MRSFFLSEFFEGESGDRLLFSVVEKLKIVDGEVADGLAAAVVNYYRYRNEVACGTKENRGVLRSHFRRLGGKREDEPKNENAKTNPISG